MAKKITMEELRLKMADPTTTAEQLRGYFRVGEESGPFAPKLDLNLDTVEAPPVDLAGRERSALLLNWANSWCRNDRRKRFMEKLSSNYKGPIIVSEGDSWFQYPLLLDDVIEVLMNDYAILSLDAAGDTLQNMLEEREFISAVKSTNASILLFSGGGNDLLAGGHLAEHLRAFDAKLSPEQHLLPSFDNVLGDAMGWYDMLLRTTERELPGVKLIGHGYDHSIPANGRWLGKPMQERGITDPAVQFKIAKIMVDRLNEQLAKLAKDFAHVTILDNRDTIAKKDWYDELHPTDEGFAQIAARFKAAINAAAAPAKPKPLPQGGGRAAKQRPPVSRPQR